MTTVTRKKLYLDVLDATYTYDEDWDEVRLLDGFGGWLQQPAIQPEAIRVWRNRDLLEQNADANRHLGVMVIETRKTLFTDHVIRVGNQTMTCLPFATNSRGELFNDLDLLDYMQPRQLERLEEMHAKFRARLMLAQRKHSIYEPDAEEWYGINLLERDGELS